MKDPLGSGVFVVWLRPCARIAQEKLAATAETTVELAGAADGHQHVEQLRQTLFPGAAGSEAGGKFVKGEGNGAGGEGVRHGAHLRHGVFGPRQRLGCSGDGCGGRIFTSCGDQLGLFGRSPGGGMLEFRAQPADQAARFLGGALGVERDQAFEDCRIKGALCLHLRHIRLHWRDTCVNPPRRSPLAGDAADLIHLSRRKHRPRAGSYEGAIGQRVAVRPLLRIVRWRHSGIHAHCHAQQRQQVAPAVGV